MARARRDGKVIERCGRDGRRHVAAALTGAVILVAMLGDARQAAAYDNSEHIRHGDQAYQILNLLRRGAFYSVEAAALNPGDSFPPLFECPASVCPPTTCAGGSCPEGTRWKQFIAEAMAAPDKLGNVRSDLRDPGPRSPDCGGVFPANLGPGELANCLAKEVPFAPRRGFASNSNECFLRRGYVVGGADQNPAKGADGERASGVIPFFQDLPSNYTGAVLGEWGTGPDDASNDTQLFIRPTNLILLSTLKSVAIEIVDTALLVVFVPFACAFELIGGGDCWDNAIDDARDPAHTFDPVALADDAILEIEEQILVRLGDRMDTVFGIPTAGLWHFASVSQSPSAPPGLIGAGQGDFNVLPGYHGTAAQIAGGYDSLDVGFIALTDFTGYTLAPDFSDGVANYTLFEDGRIHTRLPSDWASSGVGHVEFDPIQNLAQYGWKQFKDPGSGRGGARGLGWVLHAIGDAGQPHHTLGTLGYGHALWERFANLTWEQNFHEENLVNHYHHLNEILEIAYRWWKFLDDAENANRHSDLPVREFISAFAVETFSLPATRAAAISGISVDYGLSKDDAKVTAAYNGQGRELLMLGLMRRAVAASLAFEVKAAAFVPGPGFQPSVCACPTGTARSGQVPGDILPVLTPNSDCVPCGTGVFLTLPVLVDGRCTAYCPADKPTIQAGVCVAVNVCPPTTPFVDSGQCVARCGPTSVVVNGRLCQTSCPPGQAPGTPPNAPATFCVPVASVSVPPECSTVVEDALGVCCAPPSGLCISDLDCCSAFCAMNDGVCKSAAGTSCTRNAECRSGACQAGVCGIGSAGAPCGISGDCGSGVCVTRTCGISPTGGPCLSQGDCAATDFCSEGTCIANGE
ncbi:MAG: hypothetical protein ABIS92_18375 [Polyangia bacterium]